ncbi:uncharacterized protein EMH_0097140 [Eimeria mitis]|uniref:Uncharacterized protein n=1 Tax=Eimeria mitis TaxID=44415 RepID=U6KFQ8_9EIME|nr:uncharacterized protein EMH_0097140 [Eimeria mitis]CDJ36835.1 hypothetical protein EMH_0097140 [Eimeria mitis]
MDVRVATRTQSQEVVGRAANHPRYQMRFAVRPSSLVASCPNLEQRGEGADPRALDERWEYAAAARCVEAERAEVTALSAKRPLLLAQFPRKGQEGAEKGAKSLWLNRLREWPVAPQVG